MNGPKTERVELTRICPECHTGTNDEKCSSCGRTTWDYEMTKKGHKEMVSKADSDPITYDGSGIPGGRDGMTAQEIIILMQANEKKEEADSAPAYTFRNQHINKRMMEPIRAYINHGARPGPFLQAIICNDLLNAFGQADDENYSNIHAFVGYFYNEAPGNCWGSKKKMEAWMDKKLAEREGG